MSKFLWLIDAGHGGIDSEGNYTTAPKKMFKHEDFTAYEGVTNRAIAREVGDLLSDECIDYNFIHEPVKDISLSERVLKADRIYANDKRAIFLSIHSNAGGGRGIEVFTSKGQTKSDKIAQVFYDVFEQEEKWKMRKDLTDGDDDKEANFYVLRKTDCPAVLLELLFFDNKQEAIYLNSEEGQRELARLIVKAIKNIENFITI